MSDAIVHAFSMTLAMKMHKFKSMSQFREAT